MLCGSRYARCVHPTLAAAVFDATPDPIVVVDDRGVVVHANAPAIDMFGHGDALVGMAVDLLVPAAARNAHAALRQGYTAEPATRPMALGAGLRAARADGTTVPVEIALSPLTIEDETYTVATIRDVSEWLAVRTGLRRDQARVELLEERERIARDLHDMVIQRIFATGMSLQAAIGMIPDNATRDRVMSAIDELDETIRDIRNTIFELHLQHRPPVSARVAERLSERNDTWGLVHHIDDAVDMVDPDLADDIVAVVTESLSNISRHANASSVNVSITVDHDELCVRVDDDGIGMSNQPGHGRGLHNLRERALRHSGRCTWVNRPEGGTSMRWSVPLLSAEMS